MSDIARTVTVDASRPPPGEGSVAELEAWCRLAYDVTPIGISFVSLDRRALTVNPAMCRLLGRTEDEIRSLSIAELTHPDDVDLHLEPQRELLAGERDRYTIEKRYLRPDGSAVWAALHVVAVRDDAGEPRLLISQCEDISEVRAAREELEAEQARFAALVRRSSDLILLVGQDGRIDYASPASIALLGEDPDDLRGRRVDELVHPEDRRLLDAAVQAGTGPDGGMSVACRVVRADGELRHVEAVASDWTGRREAEGTVLNVRDVTERVVAVSELAWQASHDRLTALGNREWFLDQLDEALRESRPVGDGPALLLLDVDGFRALNDAYGFAAGDRVLTTVARRVERRLRPGDLVARLGADELAVLVFDADAGDGTVVARRLAEAVREPIKLATGRVLPPVTVSVGVAEATGQGTVALLRDARTALDDVRDAGSGGIGVA